MSHWCDVGSSASVLMQWPGRVAQSVRCLATDGSLIADPGVPRLIPTRSHTFVEIDYEIIFIHSPPFR